MKENINIHERGSLLLSIYFSFEVFSILMSFSKFQFQIDILDQVNLNT